MIMLGRDINHFIISKRGFYLEWGEIREPSVVFYFRVASIVFSTFNICPLRKCKSLYNYGVRYAIGIFPKYYYMLLFFHLFLSRMTFFIKLSNKLDHFKYTQVWRRKTKPGVRKLFLDREFLKIKKIKIVLFHPLLILKMWKSWIYVLC